MAEEKSAARKCPRCGHQTLEIEFEKGKIKCTNCGFEEFFKTQG